MPNPHPLKHRELLKRLRGFGVVEVKGGKGSERILGMQGGLEAGKYKGPQITIKDHGGGTMHSVRVVDAVLRRFAIRPEDFWM